MTAKITVERISAQEIRVTLVADVQISGNLIGFVHPDGAANARYRSAPTAAPTTGATRDQRFVTVEEAAKILRISRDKIYYLLRTGQLRSIKIGKSRRIARQWITELAEQLETHST